MTNYNLGLRYQQPYESGYAIVRRFLAANPSYSFASLSSQIRSCKYGADFLDRIIRLHGNTINLDYTKSTHIGRQCPECAYGHFHTSLYDYPWVKVCPIHLIPLTINCPNCEKPWPNIQEIDKRNCEVCGRHSIDITTPFESLKLNFPSTSPVRPYYELIEKEEDQSLTIISDNFNNYAFKSISAMNAGYFSCHSIISQKLFTQINQVQKIKKVRTFCIRSNLYNNKIVSAYSVAELNWKCKKKFFSNSLLQIKVALDAFNNIISYLKNRLGTFHKLIIFDFRFLDMRDLSKLGTVCPYCMAFSLWLFNVFYIEDNFDFYPGFFVCKKTYPFTGGTGFSPKKWIEMDTKIYKSYKEHYFFGKEALEKLYIRSLLIHFVRLLDYSYFINQLLSEPGQTMNEFWSPPFSYTNEALKSELYYAVKNEDMANIFFFIQNPLQEIKIESNRTQPCCVKKEWRNQYQSLKHTHKCQIEVNHIYSLDEFYQLHLDLDIYFMSWNPRC